MIERGDKTNTLRLVACNLLKLPPTAITHHTVFLFLSVLTAVATGKNTIDTDTISDYQEPDSDHVSTGAGTDNGNGEQSSENYLGVDKEEDRARLLHSAQGTKDEATSLHHHEDMIITETAPYPHTDIDHEATINDTDSSPCNRRLSRAARSLLDRHLRSILSSAKKFYPDDDNNDSNYNTDIDEESATIWQLLEHALAPHAYNNNNNNNQCPLLPTQDVLRRDEEHSVVLLAPPKNTASRLGLSTRSSLYQLHKRAWLSQTLFQCGFCGKLFSSRFYLDRHLDEHQSHHSQPNGENGNSHNHPQICPATTWCRGLPSCSQHALEMEPYYGRGSNGMSPSDRNEVRRELEAESDDVSHCDEVAMQRTKRQCLAMMQDCFGTTSSSTSQYTNDDGKKTSQQRRQEYIHQHLRQSLCEPISCPDRLHQLFFAATAESNQATSMMMQSIHEWHDEWEHYYAQHHTMSKLGMALLVSIILWYAIYLYRTVTNNQGGYKWLRQKDPKGTRLLQKRSSPSLLKTARKKLLGSSSLESSKRNSSKPKSQ